MPVYATGPGAVVPTDANGMWFRFINFDKGGAALKPEHTAFLDGRVVQLLLSDNNKGAWIQGSVGGASPETDDPGLADQRAASVMVYLGSKGVPAAQVKLSLPKRMSGEDAGDRAVEVRLATGVTTVDPFGAPAQQREAMITALQAELAAAASDASRYDKVALLLNGFNKADIQWQTAGLSVEQLRGTRAAVERVLAGWPAQQTILDAIDEHAVAKNARLRPLSSSIWAAYSPVNYDLIVGEQMMHKVWELVGGSLGRGFENQNTCATRLSYSFNYGGYPIRESDSGWIYVNNPQTVYKGKAGDGKRYIVSAPYMEKYLRNKWGPPDVTLTTNADARAFEATLRPDQVAVFAGLHHSGLIKQGYRGDYVTFDPGVMPVVAWKLP